MTELPQTTPKNQSVVITKITYTMIHSQLLDPLKMKPTDVAYHLTDGEFVGARTAIETVPIPDEEVDLQLIKVGGSPGWFNIPDPALA